jgi:hypothetical protein
MAKNRNMVMIIIKLSDDTVFSLTSKVNIYNRTFLFWLDSAHLSLAFCHELEYRLSAITLAHRPASASFTVVLPFPVSVLITAKTLFIYTRESLFGQDFKK